MSLGIKEIMEPNLLSNKSIRELLYHLLLYLHPKTKVNIIVKVHRILDLGVNNLMVVWHKEIIGPLHVLNVV